jgi:hypothetical protein
MCLPLGASAIGIAAIPGDYLAAAQWAVTAQPFNVGTFRAFRDAKRLSDRDCNAGTGGPRSDDIFPAVPRRKLWRAVWNKTAIIVEGIGAALSNTLPGAVVAMPDTAQRSDACGRATSGLLRSFSPCRKPGNNHLPLSRSSSCAKKRRETRGRSSGPR